MSKPDPQTTKKKTVSVKCKLVIYDNGDIALSPFDKSLLLINRLPFAVIDIDKLVTIGEGL